MKRLNTIHIQGVQAHADSVIVFGQVTTIVGDTNAGKTAIFRAIRGLVENAPPRSLLRDGYEFFRVDLYMSDAGIAEKRISWVKGGGKNQYGFFYGPEFIDSTNSRVFENVGALPPAFVDERLKLGPKTDSKGGKWYPNFRTQVEPPSFVYESESERLTKLTKMSGVGNLQVAMRLLQKDLKATVTNLERERTDVKALQAELKTYSDVKVLLRETVGARDKVRALNQREALLGVIDRLKDKRADSKRYDSMDVCGVLVGQIRPKVALWEKCEKLLTGRASVVGLNTVDSIAELMTECRRKVRMLQRMALLADLREKSKLDVSEVSNRVAVLKENVKECWSVNRLLLARSEAARLLSVEQAQQEDLRVATERRDVLRGDIKECPLCGRSG
jgi:DNA repair exonuclease SbcCD ATPase subunit